MADFKVYTIDSKIGSYPMVKMIEIGQKLIENGTDVEEVVEHIENMTKIPKLSFISFSPKSTA